MTTAPPRPTLWRTCRVLANTRRLTLLATLLRKQPQSVSELAVQCSLTLPVASQALRALEARSLLRAKRVRRRVEYRFPTRAEGGPLADLLAALRAALSRDPVATGPIAKLATGFTHPARIKIYAALQPGPRTRPQLQATVGLSTPAILRHLRKLRSRGYIRLDEEQSAYARCEHADAIGRALSRLAAD
jgi:predicted ArsR family transcriptional regulator